MISSARLSEKFNLAVRGNEGPKDNCAELYYVPTITITLKQGIKVYIPPVYARLTEGTLHGDPYTNEVTI
jgi:hypothetical protein